MFRENAYYLRRLSIPRVSRCPAGIDRGYEIISGFGRHLGLCDTTSLDLMSDKTEGALLQLAWKTARKRIALLQGKALL